MSKSMLIAVMLAALLLTGAGCRQQMGQQPSYRPLEPSKFFADGRSARRPPPGIVARGELEAMPAAHDGAWPASLQRTVRFTGLVGSSASQPLAALTWLHERRLYVYSLPMPITEELLQRGQQRFNIFCAVCHDRAGTGHGMIVRRGFTRPPSFHTDVSRGFAIEGSRLLLRDAPDGYYFQVITRGFGAMPSYREQVPTRDRWAIIAYVRALQLSQSATLEDVADARIRKNLLEADHE